MDDLNTKMKEIKSSFYEENMKHVFFNKNKQKQIVAQSICEKLDLYDMMRHTAWIIPYTNKIYFDYHMFKMFANPNNYFMIISEILKLCNLSIQNHNSFSVHINFLGFSISAAERYKSVIELFCNECLSRNQNYSSYLESINIYNTPQFIENIGRIFNGFIPLEVKPKIKKYTKQESEYLLSTLFIYRGIEVNKQSSQESMNL